MYTLKTLKTLYSSSTCKSTKSIKMGDKDGKELGLTPELLELDRSILSQTDEEYTRITWEAAKHAIAIDELHLLTRLPSQLRAYRKWGVEVKREYGSVMTFLVQKRLHWKPLPSDDPKSPPLFEYKSPIPFQERSDYRILNNDWPYGFTPEIRHICVWLKNRTPTEKTRGSLTLEGRDMVDTFIKKTFDEEFGVVGQDKVIWFKNQTLLQSIPGVDHIHVLIRGVNDELIDEILENPSNDELS